jgi:hypothetical protein
MRIIPQLKRLAKAVSEMKRRLVERVSNPRKIEIFVVMEGGQPEAGREGEAGRREGNRGRPDQAAPDPERQYLSGGGSQLEPGILERVPGSF